MPRLIVAALAATSLFAVPGIANAAEPEDGYKDPTVTDVIEAPALAPQVQIAPRTERRVENGARRLIRRERVRFAALLGAPEVRCVQLESAGPARLVCAFRARLLQVLSRRRGDWHYRTPSRLEVRDFADGGERLGSRGLWFERRLRVRLRSCIGAVRLRISGSDISIRPLYAECGRLRLP